MGYCDRQVSQIERVARRFRTTAFNGRSGLTVIACIWSVSVCSPAMLPSDLGLLRCLGLNRSLRLLLHHHCTRTNMGTLADVLHLQPRQIARSKFAINCKIEHSQLANVRRHLEPGAYRPNFRKIQRRLLAGWFSLVPRHTVACLTILRFHDDPAGRLAVEAVVATLPRAASCPTMCQRLFVAATTRSFASAHQERFERLVTAESRRELTWKKARGAFRRTPLCWWRRLRQSQIPQHIKYMLRGPLNVPRAIRNTEPSP
ncbi:hypothetical protein SAMN05216550_1152 [Paraburkholderia tropica]|uniref:Uncharacterized protein n=1 Tax=Paraburkholderia tropica TaxID=92647 RepID=A0AAQ1GKA9_9BURK|nr:hypothetical protein SAMN05216550_1152 [Paraburkholderia tropica]